MALGLLVGSDDHVDDDEGDDNTGDGADNDTNDGSGGETLGGGYVGGGDGDILGGAWVEVGRGHQSHIVSAVGLNEQLSRHEAAGTSGDGVCGGVARVGVREFVAGNGQLLVGGKLNGEALQTSGGNGEVKECTVSVHGEAEAVVDGETESDSRCKCHSGIDNFVIGRVGERSSPLNVGVVLEVARTVCLDDGGSVFRGGSSVEAVHRGIIESEGDSSINVGVDRFDELEFGMHIEHRLSVEQGVIRLEILVLGEVE